MRLFCIYQHKNSAKGMGNFSIWGGCEIVMEIKTNIIICVALCILLLTMFSPAVFASIDKTYVVVENIDANISKVHIGGLHLNGRGQQVTILVISNDSEDPFYWSGKETSDDGVFEFTYDMIRNFDKSGWYNILLGGAGATPVPMEYLFVNASDDAIITNMINASENAKDLEAVLDEKGETIGIRRGQGTLFSLISESGCQKVYEALCNRDFYDASAILDGFNQAVVIQMINEADVTEASNIISKYSDYFGFDIGPESYYGAIKYSHNKNFVYSSVVGKDFSLKDVHSVRVAFDRAVALAVLNDMDVSNRDKITCYIYDFNDKGYMDVSLDLYNSSFFNDLERVNIINEIINKKNKSPFNSFSNFEYIFEETVVTARDSKNKKQYSLAKGDGGTTITRAASIKNEIDADISSNAKQDEIFFNDIDHVQWAIESILYLAGQKIVSGVADNTFVPDRSITREEFVKMLVIALNINIKSAGSDFTDVKKDEWYYQYISAAQEKGIINGIDGKSFGIGQPITREQLCTMVYRAIESLGINIEVKRKGVDFVDKDKISLYARESVDYLYRTEIISGVGENVFAPDEEATRAMTAKIIYNLLEGSGLV